MPKIKVKNIPNPTCKRICFTREDCTECPFDIVDHYTKCMISRSYDQQEKIVELSEKDFPTNREWMESLSDKALAALMTTGYMVETGKYKGYTVTTSIRTPINEVLDWLSQPCQYLMEEEENDSNDIR